ncbi:MAG: divalent-cation tolerance protein CutA, partial [Phycisphaeraceae bacterium]
MIEAVTVYITASSDDEARRLATGLIQSRLVACVNILGKIDSVFYWGGSIQRESEVALVAKALRSDFAAINGKVRELHSYDCPCIVAWPIIEADVEFLQWVADETRGKRRPPAPATSTTSTPATSTTSTPATPIPPA